MSEQIEIPDSALQWIILGAFASVVRFNPAFPVMVEAVKENFDSDEQIESFTIITRSGLRFRVRVDYEEET